MTFAWEPAPENYTLAKPAHCAWLAKELTRKSADGLAVADKELIRQALDACAFHAYPPPRELVELIAIVLKVPRGGRKRTGVRDVELFRTAARVKAETGLTGRELARKLKDRGHVLSYRTLNSWEKLTEAEWEEPRNRDTPPPHKIQKLSAKAARRMQTVADFEHLVRLYRGEEQD